MYNTVIRHVYNLRSDHPDKSSTPPTPHIVITVLLAVFSSYTLHPHDYLVTTSLYLSIPSPFLPSPMPLPTGNHRILLCFACLLILFFRFHIEVKSCGICLSLSYFTQQIPSRSIHFVTKGNISFFFYGQVVLPCMCAPPLFEALLY